MSRAPTLRPVDSGHAVDEGLMRHRAFFHVVPGEGLVCWLCGRVAVYLTDPKGDRPMPWCAKHARDF